MPCLECGNSIPCRAHILPKQAGREIIKRSGLQTLSLAAPDRTNNFIQSGFFDDDILCARCDSVLGTYDKQAIEILRLLSTERETINRVTNRFTVTRGHSIDHAQLALFGAAVVWRTAVSKVAKQTGFTLGKNEAWLRDIIFRHNDQVPAVLIARLIGRNSITNEAAMTAMSYPVGIKIRGIHVARFNVGGLLFLVQTTRAPDASLSADSVTAFGKSAGLGCLTGVITSFEGLADLRQVEKSMYVQHVIAQRR